MRGVRQPGRGVRRQAQGPRRVPLQDGVQGRRAGQHAGQAPRGRGRTAGQAPQGAQAQDHQLGQEEVRDRHAAAAVLHVAGHHGPRLPGTLEAHVRVPAGVQAAGVAQAAAPPDRLPVRTRALPTPAGNSDQVSGRPVLQREAPPARPPQRRKRRTEVVRQTPWRLGRDSRLSTAAGAANDYTLS